MKYRLFFLLLMLAVVPARAGMVVIANAHSRIVRLSSEEVIDIYMGRYRTLPDGTVVHPLEPKGNGPERRNFYKRLMDKSPADIDAYWARLVLSDSTVPPERLATQREILDRVAHDPNAIAYVESIRLNSHVKVVCKLPD